MVLLEVLSPILLKADALQVVEELEDTEIHCIDAQVQMARGSPWVCSESCNPCFDHY